MNKIPELSGLPLTTVRDHLMGGVAPGNCPVPFPRQPTGCATEGWNFGEPSGAASAAFTLHVAKKVAARTSTKIHCKRSINFSRMSTIADIPRQIPLLIWNPWIFEPVAGVRLRDDNPKKSRNGLRIGVLAARLLGSVSEITGRDDFFAGLNRRGL